LTQFPVLASVIGLPMFLQPNGARAVILSFCSCTSLTLIYETGAFMSNVRLPVTVVTVT